MCRCTSCCTPIAWCASARGFWRSRRRWRDEQNSARDPDPSADDGKEHEAEGRTEHRGIPGPARREQSRDSRGGRDRLQRQGVVRPYRLLRGKAEAYGWFRGRRADWKKGIVTLAPGHKIDLVEGA